MTQIDLRSVLVNLLFRVLGVGEDGDMWYRGPDGYWRPVEDKPAPGTGAGYIPTLQADDSVRWQLGVTDTIDLLLFDDDGNVLLDDDGHPLLADS